MKYPLFKVHMPIEESLAEIKSVFESGFVNEGQQVLDFQKALEKYLDVTNLVLTNSCTSALTLAYKLSGVGPEAEVISPAMTCVATNTPIVNLGGRIVWADIDPESGSIDPSDVERKITPRTRAIVVVNWAGTPCELNKIKNIGRRHKIPIVQDAAHSFGATYGEKPISEFADFTCLSFQAIKHLSTGDGGALICQDETQYLLAKKLKWFGYDREAVKDEKGEWKGQRWSADIKHNEVGYKFSMNNISAAIGLAQMPHMDGLLQRHRMNAAVYREQFRDSQHIRLLKVPAEANSSYWVFTCLYVGGVGARDLLMEKLNAEGIAAGLVHLPNDGYSAFSGIDNKLPGTKAFSASQISLPCGWWISEEDSKFIAGRVKTISSHLN